MCSDSQSCHFLSFFQGFSDKFGEIFGKIATNKNFQQIKIKKFAQFIIMNQGPNIEVNIGEFPRYTN